MTIQRNGFNEVANFSEIYYVIITTLWAFTDCYRDNFILLIFYIVSRVGWYA
jgi:hypothetical protein